MALARFHRGRCGRSVRSAGFVAACALLAMGGCAVGQSGTPSNPSPTPRSQSSDVGSIPAGRRAIVERVIDGDTIVVVDGERVRLIGIDTPETVKPATPVECFGREATRRMNELLPVGIEIVLVADVDTVDRYGRTLSYIYRVDDGLFVNAAMVREGFAFAYTVPPDVAHADEFAALQAGAQAANRGLWSACSADASRG